jgi:hypothetical protein
MKEKVYQGRMLFLQEEKRFPIAETPLFNNYPQFPIAETPLFNNSPQFTIVETPLFNNFTHFPHC